MDTLRDKNHARRALGSRARRRGRSGDVTVARFWRGQARAASPATPASRAAGWRCWLQRLGARGAPAIALRAADRRRACSTLPRVADGMPTHASATSATPRRCAARDARRRGPRSCSTWPRSRWCARRYARAGRDLSRPTSWAPCNVLEALRGAAPACARVVDRHDRQVLREPRVGRGATARTMPLGGHDPYSSSKAAPSSSSAAYRAVVLRAQPASPSRAARAGNVIGGGDWARRPAGPRHRARRSTRGEPVHDAQPRRDPALAARARAAGRLPACSAERLLDDRRRDRARPGTSARPTTDARTVARRRRAPARGSGRRRAWRRRRRRAVRTRPAARASTAARRARELGWRPRWTLRRGARAHASTGIARWRERRRHARRSAAARSTRTRGAAGAVA